MTYAADRLWRQVAYVAYHFHWSLDDILDLPHSVRVRFLDEIDRIKRAATHSVGKDQRALAVP